MGTAEVRPGREITLSGPARSAKGPAVVELQGATCWVPPGWTGVTDAHGTLVLERA